MQGKGLREPARVDLLRGVQQVCGGLAAEAEVRWPFSAKLTKASAVLALLVNSRWESSTPQVASARAIL